MAINWMDDFRGYGVGNAGSAAANRMLNGSYAQMSNDLSASPDPIDAGITVLRVSANIAEGSYVTRKVLNTARATVGVAGRYWFGNLPAGANQVPKIVVFQDVNAADLLYVALDPSGNLFVTNSAGTVLGITPNPVIVANAFQHIETKVFFANGTGTVEVRVEGVTVLNLAAKVTTVSGNLCQNITFRQYGQFTPYYYLKDFIIWDDTGAFNNNFMGSCQVYRMMPDADVALNWTPFPADGVGYTKINELTPDDDTTYISAPYPAMPAAYKCSLQDLPVTVTSVRGVQISHRSRKTDGGDGNIQAALISSGVTGLGSNRPITTAYTFWTDVYDADPNGGIQWTRIAANALTLQLNRTV